MNDPTVRFLYEDFYKRHGVISAWSPHARMRQMDSAKAGPHLKGGKGMSSQAKAKLSRIARKAPEVMVKVSGRTYGSGHLKAHMNYVTRNGKVGAETEYGLMKGKEAVGDLHQDWSDDDAIYRGHQQVRKGPLSVNMVLSMPQGVDASAFKDAVRDFTDKELRPRVDVMVAFHDDTAHPHAHVTVRGRQHNGRVFNPGPAVLEKYRERFAEALRDRGVDAEASPRFARGRTLKSERQAFRHMRARGVMPRTQHAAVGQAFDDVKRTKGDAAGHDRRHRSVRSRPWETASRARYEGVKTVYTAAARDLAQSASASDRSLARQVERFIRSMKPPQFKHVLYKQAFQNQIVEQRHGSRDDRQLGKERAKSTIGSLLRANERPTPTIGSQAPKSNDGPTKNDQDRER